MYTPEQVQHAVEAKTTRLRQLEAPYLRAKEFLKSLEWQTTRDKVLMKVEQAISRYQGKDANEATYIMGKLSAYILEIQEPTDIIIEYEGLKRELEMYHAQRGE